ncbi:uncharacterized protein [Phyllobates terribilis]|uniref:uncharacterized protein n=1 Tax=Phyllobates terribilis TaxID=111132 RepID=UPI003CCB310F
MNSLRHVVMEELAGLGATVNLCSRKEEELNKCLHEWRAKGFSLSGSVCGVSCRDHRQKLMEEVSSVFSGKLNKLVNNAGTNFRKATVDYTTDEYAQIMSTNFVSAYNLCKLSHPLLKSYGSGSIIFISSVASVLSLGTGSVYAASKATMNQITITLACEWAKDNISVLGCISDLFSNSFIIRKQGTHHIFFYKSTLDNILEESIDQHFNALTQSRHVHWRRDVMDDNLPVEVSEETTNNMWEPAKVQELLDEVGYPEIPFSVITKAAEV